jgi:hypothetical protein
LHRFREVRIGKFRDVLGADGIDGTGALRLARKPVTTTSSIVSAPSDAVSVGVVCAWALIARPMSAVAAVRRVDVEIAAFLQADLIASVMEAPPAVHREKRSDA